MKKVIELTPAEIQSGVTRVTWAAGLIRQLPEDHDGRNSWLLNYSAVYEMGEAPWNGEGLPPVGLEVEAWYSIDTLPGWKPFKLKYYSEESVVFEGLGETYASRETFDRYGLKFRPIRTAEEIAAEERENAVEEMRRTVAESDRFLVSELEALYDAGYRKVGQ